jgi:transcription elongation factor SPT5
LSQPTLQKVSHHIKVCCSYVDPHPFSTYFYSFVAGKAKGSDWAIPNIEAAIIQANGGSFNGGAHDHQKVVIVESSSGASCKVRSLTTSQEMDVPITYLEPVRPTKKDRVKVMSGEYKGREGELIGVDGQDGIVKMISNDPAKAGGTEFKILDLAVVGKMAE